MAVFLQEAGGSLGGPVQSTQTTRRVLPSFAPNLPGEAQLTNRLCVSCTRTVIHASLPGASIGAKEESDATLPLQGLSLPIVTLSLGAGRYDATSDKPKAGRSVLFRIRTSIVTDMEEAWGKQMADITCNPRRGFAALD